MSASSRKNRIPQVLFFLFLIGSGAVYFQWGYGCDGAFSKIISRRLGFDVQLTGVRWQAWDRLQFEGSRASGNSSEPWFGTGRGWIRLHIGPSLFSQAEFTLTNARLEPALFSRALGRAVGSQRSLFLGPLPVERAVLGFRQEKGKQALRIYALVSKNFSGRGGFRWSNGRLETLHGMLLLSPEWKEKIPGDWLDRFPSNGRGQKIVKADFRDHQWTLFGRSGPLLRASWQAAL